MANYQPRGEGNRRGPRHHYEYEESYPLSHPEGAASIQRFNSNSPQQITSPPPRILPSPYISPGTYEQQQQAHAQAQRSHTPTSNSQRNGSNEWPQNQARTPVPPVTGRSSTPQDYQIGQTYNTPISPQYSPPPVSARHRQQQWSSFSQEQGNAPPISPPQPLPQPYSAHPAPEYSHQPRSQQGQGYLNLSLPSFLTPQPSGGRYERTPANSISNASTHEDGFVPSTNYDSSAPLRSSDDFRLEGAVPEPKPQSKFNLPSVNINPFRGRKSKQNAYEQGSVQEIELRRPSAGSYPGPNAPFNQYSTNSASPDNPYIFESRSFPNRFVAALNLKSGFSWAAPNFFHPKAFYRWETPCSYQLPGVFYPITALRDMRDPTSVGYPWPHLDVFHREYLGREDDRYLDPLDGKVVDLIVQCTKDIYNQRNDSSWRRTYMENISPFIIRLAYWPTARMPEVDKSKMVRVNDGDDRKTGIMAWGQEQWVHVGLRWLPACIGLLILMFYPTDVEGQVRNNGLYDPFPYRFWSYAKSARNPKEEAQGQDALRLKATRANFQAQSSYPNANNQRSKLSSKVSTNRWLRPRLLCFVQGHSYIIMAPETWKDSYGHGRDAAYVLVSYTAEGQFGRRCKTSIVDKNGMSTCTCEECRTSNEDARALHEMGIAAANNAGVPAYWTDQCCMSRIPSELSEDVYQISDVVRGAHSIAIVVGQTGKARVDTGVTTIDLLKAWGQRMWTWPEILLSSSKMDIGIYTRGTDYSNPCTMPKSEFPSVVWDDGEVARQLIDHYENTLSLSRLELPILALQCLAHRVERGTTKFLEGDLSYALMGLLRQRPHVDPTDSAFQAFARLSLANDSDKLLERMICLLPTSINEASGAVDNKRGDHRLEDHHQTQQEPEENKRRHYWTNMNDFWEAQLWDIDPICQISGIGHDDTVIIDGAFAAAVHWGSFQRVAITTRETWTRLMARSYLRGAPVWLLIGISVVSVPGSSTTKGIGAIFLIISLSVILLAPFLILHIYGGKVWNTQPWLFGFEGHMDIKEIEIKLFGFPNDRLSWAPHGSALAHHRLKSRFLPDECEGFDPLLATEEITAATGSNSTENKMRLFTLVDTNTMTVTMFKAERPPIVGLICGSEGGMQRAVMCSYDWTTQTLYRETVLRMETKVLEKMSRVGRVRFGIKRWPKTTRKNDLSPPGN